MLTNIKILVNFQEVSEPRHEGMPAWTETDLRGLNLDCLTDFHITQLGGHKRTGSVTYQAENNSLEQMRDVLFHIKRLLTQISGTLSQTRQAQLSQADNEECRKSWMMVAMVIDRFLLVLFSLLTIIVSTVLLLNHPSYHYSHANEELESRE